jgi:hypothetical protein
VISPDTVKEAWKIANEHYAQVGVRVNVNGIVAKDPPVGRCAAGIEPSR